MNKLINKIPQIFRISRIQTYQLSLTNGVLKLKIPKKSSNQIYTISPQNYLSNYMHQNKKQNTQPQRANQEQIEQQVQQFKQNWLQNGFQNEYTQQIRQQFQQFDDQAKSQAIKTQKSLFNMQNHSIIKSTSNRKVQQFKKQLSKKQLVNNSMKFLDYICNAFSKQHAIRITNQIKQFSKKLQFNLPELLQPIDKNDKRQMKNHQKALRVYQKQIKQRQRKLFNSIYKILNQFLNDIDSIDQILNLLSVCDPNHMKLDDIHNRIYNHQQGFFQNSVNAHKDGINLILDKKQRKPLLADDSIKNNQNKKYYIRQRDNRPKISLLDIQKQDITDLFQDFTTNEEKKVQIKPIRPIGKLVVKKKLNQQQIIPGNFQINQQSMHEVERILFKNKKITQQRVVFKKIKDKRLSPKIQKQREQFGKNWIYGYQMPYALTHQSSQQFIDFLSFNYGQIAQYYIFPFKSMLQKRESIIIHVQNKKRQQKLQLLKSHANSLTFQDLQAFQKSQKVTADKLLQKIQKQEYLQLNRSSMVFKFKDLQLKQKFLLPEMRLFGINYKDFKTIRFQQAQVKKLLSLSMIPWGCSTQDLIRTINKALKPLQVQVSYQTCILAKSYVFIQFQNFYQNLIACRLLNNLQFQGHQLKVQLNYGSSKIYNGKYKNNLEFDHYQTLVKKMKDINCFYNQVYTE